jgi:hypothetical protein
MYENLGDIVMSDGLKDQNFITRKNKRDPCIIAFLP